MSVLTFPEYIQGPLLHAVPKGTEGSGREASLFSSSLCHFAWRCFKLEEERKKGGRERTKGEGKGARGGREEGEKEKECVIINSYWA